MADEDLYESQQSLLKEADDGQQNVQVRTGTSQEEFKVYKRRWFVLFLVTLHSTSGQMIWLSFSPIATKAAVYYDVPLSHINLFSLIFLILSIPMGFVAAWLLDTFGIRVSMVLASWVNTIGAVLRILSTVHVVPMSVRFPLAMIGQVIAASAYPVFTSCPTKVANKWFSEKQRSVATMIASFPLGYLLASLLSPILISIDEDVHGTSNIQFMLIIFTIPAVLGTLLTTFGLCSSLPPTPPSLGAQIEDKPFWTGVKEVLQIGPYRMLVVLAGCGVGLFNAVTLLLQEVMCPHGYPATFSGICGALIIGVGFIGAVSSSVLLDRTKLYEEITKVNLCLGSVFLTMLAIVTSIPDITIAVIIAASVSGFCMLGAYPILLELGVEATYPIAQATSAGLILISGHVQGIIYTLIMQTLGRPASPHTMEIQTCVGKNHTTGIVDKEVDDMTISMLFVGGLLAVTVIVFTLFFKTDYRRMNAEHSQSTE
ncbi:solute carrier family 49 member A3-like [Glandiceps talaboti]